jgi:predicted dehydrogenase
LFAQGAGPLFDIGPYYLTALAHLFGSYATVAAVATKSRETRIVQAGDRAGTEFAVEAPTLVQAVASFSGGQVAQTLFSFDSPMARTGYVEITGTEATMLVPDPNLFAGSVRLTRPVTLATVQSETEWIDVPVPDETYGRGAGALDLARCIRGGGEPIASGELGYHVLDVMASIEESIASGQTVRLASSTAPVPLLPEGWNPHEATLGAEA